MSPGRENFKAHVQELKARTCPPIIAIEEGDGSAVVKFAHRRNGRMDIHFTFTNVDGYPYPQSSHVFVYMDAVDSNAQTASKILEPYAGPCKPLISLVAQVVRDLCVHFRLPLLPPTFEQGCPTSIRANEEGSDDGETSEDGDEEIVSDEELWNEMFEECPGINECAADTLRRDMCHLLTIYDVNDVRDDKGRPKKERKPRYAAGILSAFRHGFFVWVTREFSSLGLDGNVLEAWGIDVATFPRLAIVFQFSPAYVESKDDTCDKKYPNVRVALSKKERITSFSEVSHLFSEHGEPPDTESDYDIDQWVLTEPIQQALSRRMRHVVNLRAAHSLSFVQAEALFDVLANKGTDGSASNDDIQIRSPNLDIVKNIRETFDTEGCVRPRTRRAIEDARRDENNFLFSAVEYVEYRILNTTKYCIVCYEKMDESVELLKPFVCNRPLCLYNFIDQGLGTDVEGEILRNGNVVDLLVSLAYVAACARALEPFPHGIVCKEQVPDVGTGRILKGSGRELHGCPKVDWLKDSVVGRHIRISGVPGTYRIEQVMSKSLCLMSTPVSAKWETGSGKEYTIMTTVEKTFETPTKSPDYDKVIQCISAIPSIECMANILRRADEPPVKKATLKMNASQADRVRLKKHFEKLPEGNLAYLLLRWIVCSNRAHFRELQGNEAIQGVHPNYTQFAMVTGSPEKESNFKQALKTHAGNKQALYAFHGSPLQNWHSIIRHGLWYKAIAHGRSYGDGIYHALDSGTSLGYCRGMLHQQWSASALKPGLCISLNQIVNRPEIFTSSHPHLVVQHTEWVQTRYLLVCSAHTGAPAASAILPNASTNYLPLDATYAPSMQGVRISIPHNTISRPLSPIHRIRDYMGAGEVTVVEAEVKRMISKLELISRRNDNSPVGWYKTTSKNKDASDKTDDTLRDLQPKVGIGPFVIPGVEIETVPKPSYATSTATKTLTRDLRTFVKSMGVAGTKAGAWIDVEKAGENLFCWNVYVPRESFTQTIPLVHDMKEKQLECIAFEITFLPDYPSDPPFVRILHPRMLQYQDGLGGGHVTAGGSICMGFLTSSGWNSAYAVEAVLLQVRSALENLEPFPARLDPSRWMVPYGWQEAASAYTRVARDHGWLVPDGFSTVNREMSTRK